MKHSLGVILGLHGRTRQISKLVVIQIGGFVVAYLYQEFLGVIFVLNIMTGNLTYSGSLSTFVKLDQVSMSWIDNDVFWWPFLNKYDFFPNLLSAWNIFFNLIDILLSVSHTTLIYLCVGSNSRLWRNFNNVSQKWYDPPGIVINL
jgi:hypothetical protein